MNWRAVAIGLSVCVAPLSAMQKNDSPVRLEAGGFPRIVNGTLNQRTVTGSVASTMAEIARSAAVRRVLRAGCAGLKRKMRGPLGPRIFELRSCSYQPPRSFESLAVEGGTYRPRLAFLAILRGAFFAFFAVFLAAFFAFLAMPWLL